jgi:predicted nucleic acid-binding protein
VIPAPLADRRRAPVAAPGLLEPVPGIAAARSGRLPVAHVAGDHRDGNDRRAAQALTGLADLPLQRAPHRALIERCWELRGNLTSYDAAYVALAG